MKMKETKIKIAECVVCHKVLEGSYVGSDNPKFLCEKCLDRWDEIRKYKQNAET